MLELLIRVVELHRTGSLSARRTADPRGMGLDRGVHVEKEESFCVREKWRIEVGEVSKV